MVDDRIADGVRIGELLSSEIHGHERGVLGRVSVVDADRDAEPTGDGTEAYAVAYRSTGNGSGNGSGNVPEKGSETGSGNGSGNGNGRAAGPGTPDAGDSRRIARVYLHPERVRLAFSVAPEAVAEAAEAESLPVEAGGGENGSTGERGEAVSVSVESGAAVKPTLRVVRAAAEALREERRES